MDKRGPECCSGASMKDRSTVHDRTNAYPDEMVEVEFSGETV